MGFLAIGSSHRTCKHRGKRLVDNRGLLHLGSVEKLTRCFYILNILYAPVIQTQKMRAVAIRDHRTQGNLTHLLNTHSEVITKSEFGSNRGANMNRPDKASDEVVLIQEVFNHELCVPVLVKAVAGTGFD